MLIRAILVVVLVAVGDGAFSQQPPPSGPEVRQPPKPEATSSQQPATADQRGTEEAPLVVKILPTLKTQEEARREREDREEKAASDRWLIILTGLLALGTFLQFLALVVIIRTTRRQVRAYVFIQGGEIRLINNDTAIMATIILKNFGQTPGYDFETWTNIRIGNPNEPIFGAIKTAAQKSIIAPSADLQAPSQFIPITPQERAAINSGIRVIYVWGEVKYRDAFGKRWTFIFQDKNSPLETVTTENVTGRILWRGWPINPAGYEEK